MTGNCTKGAIKKSPSAGVTKFNTGTSSLAFFIPKWKTTPTIRNLFGNATWADPFSYGSYVNQYERYDIYGSPPYSQWSYGAYSGNVGSIVLETIGGELIDPTTGNYVSAGTICFIDLDTFTYDLGNVPLKDGCFVVQSDFSSTEITLANNNRALLAVGV